MTHAVLYGLGVTIGAGIYVLISVAAAQAGMSAPLAFLGAAAVMGLSAASFAELGTRAVFSFIGFEHLVNISEEMKTPTATLPRALFLTLGLTAVIYALVVWVAVVAVPPVELARSPAPLALVFERLTGMPLLTLTAIAIVATLNGIIVHMIMIGRVVYGLAEQGNLPRSLGHVNRYTGTPVVATVVGVLAILGLAVFVPLEGLAKLTSQCTLGLFALVNVALIRIKRSESGPPADVFVCPRWIPYAGAIASAALLVIDLALYA